MMTSRITKIMVMATITAMVMVMTMAMVIAMTMVVVLNQALTIVKVVKNLVIKSNHPMM